MHNNDSKVPSQVAAVQTAMLAQTELHSPWLIKACYSNSQTAVQEQVCGFLYSMSFYHIRTSCLFVRDMKV